MAKHTYDTIIIGGGFYGLRIAQFLKEELRQAHVLVLEKEEDLMQRASYNNQARVHNGYHYPRSVLTALRSRVNFPVFVKEYEKAVNHDFIKYYGVATMLSKVSARQFERFFKRIDAPIERDVAAMKFFNPKYIEEVFRVKEYGFNTAVIKQQLLDRLSEVGAAISTAEPVLKVEHGLEHLLVHTEKDIYKAKHVLNTTYSSINHVNKASGLDLLPLKHEITEMCLVHVPPAMRDAAFTIMCGPFFSIMPFPDRKLHTLSHVRYTPHSEWQEKDASMDPAEGARRLKAAKEKSNFHAMFSDLLRYMPVAKDLKYGGESLWETKTVLPQSEGDDSRPILYKAHHGGLRNYTCIMGGKLDNIYDVCDELRNAYA